MTNFESARFDNGTGIYWGYYDPDDDWNGFACPYFDRETSETILDDIVEDLDTDCVSWEYDVALDSFMLHGDDRYADEEWTGEYDAYHDGGEDPLYCIGAREWSWIVVD